MKAASLLFASGATRARARATALPTTDAIPWPIALSGVPFANLSLRAAVEAIAAMIAQRTSQRVLTANLETLLRARADAITRRHTMQADLILCDSRSLVGASWLLGNPLPGRVRSAALVRALARLAAERSWRVFLIDPATGGAAAVGEQLQREHPGLRIVGTVSVPPGEPLETEKLTHWIREAKPDLVLAHFGRGGHGPTFEPHRRTLGVPAWVELCADLPDLMRPSPAACTVAIPPLERLRQAGRRRREQLSERAHRAFTYAPAIVRQWWHASRRRLGHGAAPAIRNAANGWVDIDAGHDLTRHACNRYPALWHIRATLDAHYSIDVSHICRIDATGLAVLARWRLALERAGRRLILVAPSAPVQSALADAQLTPLFETAASTHEAHGLTPVPAPVARLGWMRSLAWCGDIVAANHGDVRHMTSEYLRTFASAGATLVAIDLSRLRFVDGVGAGLMRDVFREGHELGLAVMFVRPRDAVRQCLHGAGLDTLLLEGAQ